MRHVSEVRVGKNLPSLMRIRWIRERNTTAVTIHREAALRQIAETDFARIFFGCRNIILGRRIDYGGSAINLNIDWHLPAVFAGQQRLNSDRHAFAVLLPS